MFPHTTADISHQMIMVHSVAIAIWIHGILRSMFIKYKIACAIQWPYEDPEDPQTVLGTFFTSLKQFSLGTFLQLCCGTCTKQINFKYEQNKIRTWRQDSCGTWRHFSWGTWLQLSLGTARQLCLGTTTSWHSSLGTFLQSCLGTCNTYITNLQTIILNPTWLQFFLGTWRHDCLGTCWQFCLGTWVHLSLGTWRHCCWGTCLQVSWGSSQHLSWGTFLQEP